MISRRVPSLIGAALLALASPALAETLHFSVVAQGRTVGHLVVDTDGKAQDIQYQVRNNGRGPTLHEKVTLAASGIPVDWTIDGTTAFGGVVQERFKWAAGSATWQSQADHGTAPSVQPPLYVANDASPWALAIYAQALLRQPQHALAVLPSGAMKLEALRQATIGQRAKATAVTAYALSGIDLAPDILILDRNGGLFAEYRQDPGSPPAVVVREGYEDQYPALIRLIQAVVTDKQRDIEKRLTHHFDQPIRIRDVRVFDPKTETLTTPQDVVVFRGRIVSLEPFDPLAKAPLDEVAVDGQGGTLMAALHDMHSHTTLQSGPLYLAAGVTTTRDMGNDNVLLLDLVQRSDAGDVLGPRIIRSGLLEGRSPYSVTMGMIPNTLDDAIRDVDRYADRGYWQIKIYNSMNPDWVKPIAAEAHRLGLRVAGHIPAFMTSDRAVEDGYDELTHANLLLLNWVLDTSTADTRTPLRITALGKVADLDFSSPRVQATLALMRAHNTGFDPTAVIIERLMLARAGTVQEADKPYLDHMPIGYQRYRMRSFVDFKDATEDEAFRKGFDKVIELIRVLDHQGTRILPGTDDPTGFTLHRELELYVKAGLAPGKVLRMATLDCDRYLGRDQDFGSVEKGKVADLILVAGDPTRNISDIRQIRMTMKGGDIYFPAELYQAMSIRPFAAPPPLRAATIGVEQVLSSAPGGPMGVSSGLQMGLDDGD